MAVVRTALQGIRNIIRFNRHYYVMAFCMMLFLLSGIFYFAFPWSFLCFIALLFLQVVIISSLLVSWYVYDHTGLYRFDWIRELPALQNAPVVVNIHAGFDESSAVLSDIHHGGTLLVFDFYDPLKHTEVSVKRARKAYPPYPGTRHITTDHLPLAAKSCDRIFLIFAAHEIRDMRERIQFFKELNRILKPGGAIVMMEHIRDLPNFLAYNIGFLHFLSRREWTKTFESSGFKIKRCSGFTPFVKRIILQHGVAH